MTKMLKRVGRPRGRKQDTVFQMRASRVFIDRVDSWRRNVVNTQPTRAQAVRHLVNEALGPPGFGLDSLSAFFEQARGNRLATFQHKSEIAGRLAAIDELFLAAFAEWKELGEDFSPMLAMRAHSAFRGASEMATAGQVSEVFPLTRTGLEYAGYALHIQQDPGLFDVWLNRHRSDEELSEAKSTFRISKVKKTIIDRHAATASIFDQLYQRSIDFGAHPNERAITGNASIRRAEIGKEIATIYLHDNDIHFDHALRTTAQVGVCILDVLRLAYPTQFSKIEVGLRNAKRGL